VLKLNTENIEKIHRETQRKVKNGSHRKQNSKSFL